MSNKIWVLTYTIGTNEGRKSLRLICDTKEQAIKQLTVLGGEVVEYIRQQESLNVNWPNKIDIDEELEKAQQRIAELESRTVTVENLQESAYRAGLTAGWNLGLANNNDGFNKCLAAHTAGIKVETE